MIAPPEELPDSVKDVLSRFDAAELGPSVRVRGDAAVNGTKAVLYEVVIWETIVFQCSVMPPDEERGESKECIDGS